MRAKGVYASQGRYSSPRIHQDLRALGIRYSLKRMARIMKEQNLVVCKARRFVVTTDSNHAFPLAQNLLNREYQVEAVTELNRAWAGDITYIPTAQSWLYVAVVLDLKSRKVIGWSMPDRLEQTLVHKRLFNQGSELQYKAKSLKKGQLRSWDVFAP